MNILYLVHQTYYNEYSGTPLITKQYADNAIKRGCNVAIMTPYEGEINFKNLNKSNRDNITLYNWPKIKNWNIEAFEQKLDSKSKINTANMDFKPNIIHVIDWIDFDQKILNFLKSFNVPIIRHIMNFEDFCYFTSPIYFNKNHAPCEANLTADNCAKCISVYNYNKKNFLGKLKSNLFQIKKKEYKQFKNRLKNRNEIANNQINDCFDHLIFPSRKFANYYLSHLKVKKKYSVINLGISNSLKKKNEISKNTKKLNIVFVGGANLRKGWDIIEYTFKRLLHRYNDRIELKIYGHKKKASKSQLRNFNSIQFYDSYKFDNIYDTMTWAHIGLVPSYFEGYCKVLHEMMACDVVPIANNFFGSEIIKNDSNGLILEKPFSEDLFKKIEFIIKNPESLKKLKYNLSKTELFFENDEFEQIFQLYKNISIN